MNNTSTILNQGNFPFISVICNATRVFMPLMNINFMGLFIFSTSWTFYLIRKLWKDYRKEKITSKSRNNQPEYLWMNAMKNFKSNRIKNSFLLAICLSEIGCTLSIILYNLSIIGINSTSGNFRNFMESWTKDPYASFPQYDEFIGSLTFRFVGSVMTISVSAMAFFIRILTQYMVCQYSYYKPHLNIKFELYISLTCLLTLFLMVTVFELITLYNICTVLLLVYEYILLIIASRKLCLLLRQHLHDAILHENQNRLVILYYQIAYKEYKYCSTIMLIALFVQYMGASLYLLNQLVINFTLDELSYWSLSKPIKLICLLQLIFISIGTSIQLILYLIVSIRRLFRYIYKRMTLNRQISSSMSSLQPLIESHNSAYFRRSGNRHML